MSQEQEIVIGLQYAPAMAKQRSGLYPDKRQQATIDNISKTYKQHLR